MKNRRIVRNRAYSKKDLRRIRQAKAIVALLYSAAQAMAAIRFASVVAQKFPPGGLANKVSSADVEQREYIIPARQINDGQ